MDKNANEYHVISAGSLLVFRSIVNQLAKDNEKFLYGCVREGARAREFEEAILLKSDFQFKGALTENYCLQQLRDCYEVLPKYFVQGQNSEIDFLLEEGMQIISVEVKEGESIKANAFRRYIEKYKVEHAIRYSALELKKQERIINIPLYLVGKTKHLWNK